MGFILKEEVIKIQHRMKTTREVWQRMRGGRGGFLLIQHEKLFIFKKPGGNEEEKRKLKYSISI